MWFAENLWNKMAWGSSVSKPKTESSGGSNSDYKASVNKSYGTDSYVCFEIMPYKDNELWFAHWESFLANFSSVKEEFFFTVRGNNKDIRLYMYAPKSLARYIENMFYSAFPTSELKKREYLSKDLHTWAEFINFSSDTKFYDAQDFSKGGSYVDPFKDVLSAFFSVPENAEAEIVFWSTFKTSKTKWQKFVAWIKDFFKKVKPTEEWDDKKDDKPESDTKKIGRDIKFSVALKFTWVSWMEKDQLTIDMKHIFDKFVVSWSVNVEPKKTSFSGNAGSFVNMFHIPTKTNQNPSLSYVEYRKLANPVNIPKPQGDDDTSITILWKTDYKGDWELFGIRKEG